MADLDQERADLNALIREAHEAIKDLNTAQRDLDETLARAADARNQVAKMIDDEVLALINASADRHVSRLPEQVDVAIQDAERRIYARFNKLAEILLGSAEEVAERMKTVGDIEKVNRVIDTNLDEWLARRNDK